VNLTKSRLKKQRLEASAVAVDLLHDDSGNSAPASGASAGVIVPKALDGSNYVTLVVPPSTSNSKPRE
jgi:hypothetical protein